MTSTSLVVILAVAAGLPLLLAAVPWLPIPGALAELLAGIVLGPTILGWVTLDGTVEAVAVLGLSLLLFLAGWEVDVRRFRGPPARAGGTSLLLSVVLAAAAGALLATVFGLGRGALVVALALLATSLGLVVPVLKDAGLADQPAGRLIVIGSSAGEVAAIVLLSLVFAEGGGSPATRLLLLGLLGLCIAGVGLVVFGAEHSMRLTGVIHRLADTTAQIRVRFTVLLVAALALAAERLGFEAILGAFLAGLLVRLVDPEPERTHPLYPVKLEAIGFGFLIPVFFVASGVALDLRVLADNPAALLRVPLYLGLLVLVRGVPAVVYRRLLSGRETVGAGLLQATSLPFLLAAAMIGREMGLLGTADATALVAAGLVSVIVFPAAALRLLAPAARPATQPAPVP